MEHILILLATGLLLNVFNKLNAELNVIPRDTEVMVNDSTYMNCSTSLEADKVHWRHGNNYVYTGRYILEPYNVRFSVEINSSTGTNNLVIRSVKPSDAGQYDCLEDEGHGEQRSAQLIVLDDDPVCKSSMHSSGVIGPNTCGIEPDEVKLSCGVTYHGNIFPVLQWKANGDNQSIIEGLVNFTTNENEVNYTLTMKSALGLNNSAFICQTTRTSNRNYSCSSDVIKILYVFSSNLTINMTMDDEVSCFANTSQSCSYKWKWFSGDDLITASNNQTLKPNKAGRHRCEATCSIGNKSCTLEPMYAEVYSTVASSGQNLLALLVLFALPITVLIGVVIYYRRKIEKLAELERKVEHKREQERQRLIDELPSEYKSDPVLVGTNRKEATEGRKKWIEGMAILDKELFAVSRRSSEVEVYDSKKFSFSRRWNMNELSDPTDIASCNRNKCLYIFDYKGYNESNEILRVDSNGKLIKKWSTGDDWGRSLSVTDEKSVILTVYNKNKLNEYSSDGQLIREINLLYVAGIRYPRHAIKLINGNFLVSHAGSDGDRPGVCVVDGKGYLIKSFAGKPGSISGEMNNPFYLAVDGNGYVLVADREDRRVLLLDSNLEFKREILSKEKHGLGYPSRILLDETSSQLFVADSEWDSKDIMRIGLILIFDLGKPKLNTSEVQGGELELLERKPEEEQQSPIEIQKTVLNNSEDLEPDNQKREQERHRINDTLPEQYKSDPVFVQKTRTKASYEKNEWISGLTILDKELFVVSEGNSEVEVYDSVKFSFSRQWDLKELIDPYDIGSCNKNKCLYIFNCKGFRESNEILRVDPYGKLITNWSTGNDYAVGLSVTDEMNVILTVYNENKLNEYSSDGQLIREINLLYDTGIHHPLHAIKLINGHFVIMHGSRGGLHRVCLVDGDGKFKKSFGGKRGLTTGQINCPVYLALDGNGFVMVVDRGNSRVLLLNSDVEFKREILSEEKHRLKDPSRILLDETNGRLFVVDREWIVIFQFNK